MNKETTLRAVLAVIFIAGGIYSITSFDSSNGNPGILLTIPVGLGLIIFGMIVLFRLASKGDY